MSEDLRWGRVVAGTMLAGLGVVGAVGAGLVAYHYHQESEQTQVEAVTHEGEAPQQLTDRAERYSDYEARAEFAAAAGLGIIAFGGIVVMVGFVPEYEEYKPRHAAAYDEGEDRFLAEHYTPEPRHLLPPE